MNASLSISRSISAECHLCSTYRFHRDCEIKVQMFVLIDHFYLQGRKKARLNRASSLSKRAEFEKSLNHGGGSSSGGRLMKAASEGVCVKPCTIELALCRGTMVFQLGCEQTLMDRHQRALCSQQQFLWGSTFLLSFVQVVFRGAFSLFSLMCRLENISFVGNCPLI